MNHTRPPETDRERLKQLPKEEIVEIVVRQALVIEQLQRKIEELKQEIEKLRVNTQVHPSQEAPALIPQS